MTSDQPLHGTSGQPSPGLEGLLPPGSVVTVVGPWTVRSCVTAACTGCGALPLDEDTSTTPHFADTSQAAQELAQNWGWHHERGTWPKDDVLLCPACAALPGGARPAPKGNGLKAAGCQVPGWELEPDPDARCEHERIIRRQREAEQEAARTPGPQAGREAEAGQ
jgi:hypothetical protein